MGPFYIEKLTLKNFMGFEHVTMECNPGVNLIVGVNGSGKTALLEGISWALSEFLEGPPSNFIEVPKFQDKWLRLKNENYMIEPTVADFKYQLNDLTQQNQMPSNPFIDTILQDKSDNWPWIWARTYKLKKGKRGKIEGAGSEKKNLKRYSEALFSNQKYYESPELQLPLLAYLSTKRLEKPFSVDERKSRFDPKHGRFNGYLRALDGDSLMPEVMDWLLKAYRDKANPEEQNPWNDWSQSNIGEMLQDASQHFGIEGLSGIYYSNTRKEFMIQNKRNLVPLTSLPDGIKNILFLCLSLAWRANKLNPLLEMGARKLATGVVLIDEIDLHLHPIWQGKVISFLQQQFPRIQFFITTHSPIVVSGFEKGSLFTMEDNHVKMEGSFYGKDVNMTLTDLFNGNERGSDEIQQKANEFEGLLGSKSFQTSKYKSLKNDLTEVLGTIDPLIVRANTLEKLFGN
jgi:predicted ATP-binding protein involved in virulence